MSFSNPDRWIRIASIVTVYTCTGLLSGLIGAALGLPMFAMSVSGMVVGAAAGIVIARNSG